LRQLAAKCANNYVIKRRSEALRPQQLGVGVPGGEEAAVHAARRLVANLPHHHVVVKLDFLNAFNRFRNDIILDNIAAQFLRFFVKTTPYDKIFETLFRKFTWLH